MNSMASFLALLFLRIASAAAVEENVQQGSIEYEGAKAFLYQLQEIAEKGKQKTITTYLDKKSKPLVREESVYEGDRLLSYSYRQLQFQEEGDLTVKEGKVFYTFRKEGKTYSGEESFQEGMFVPDGIGTILRRSWDKILAGETIRGRFLSVERQDSYGFKFFKDGELKWKEKEAVRVVMKPSSIFISLALAPISLVVEKNPPHRILETQGRLPIRVPEVPNPKTRTDWKAIDAKLVFE